MQRGRAGQVVRQTAGELVLKFRVGMGMSFLQFIQSMPAASGGRMQQALQEAIFAPKPRGIETKQTQAVAWLCQRGLELGHGKHESSAGAGRKSGMRNSAPLGRCASCFWPGASSRPRGSLRPVRARRTAGKRYCSGAGLRKRTGFSPASRQSPALAS